MTMKLEAQGISFSFRGGATVIDDWSETFAPHEVVGITGPSGRGKSTLLYLLGLMLRPSHGQLWFEGTELLGLSDVESSHRRAREYGFVFQDAALDSSRSVLDNVVETALYRGVALPPERVRAEALLTELGVEVNFTRKPGQVSGGQAQRIALARALLSSPKIVLADEPTGNLDKESALVVVDALRRQAKAGSIVIIVTHDPIVLDQCDREVRL